MNLKIRPFEAKDTDQVIKLLQDANLSLVWTGFCLAARKPTVSALIICCAISVYVWTKSVLFLVAVPITVYGLLYFILRSIVIFLWKGPAIVDLQDVQNSYQSDPRTNFWVAVDEGQNSCRGNASSYIVIASIAITQKGKPNVAFLRRVAVSQEYRRLGIARKLVKHAIHFCLVKNYDAVELVTTEAQNPARKLYEEEGFVYVKTTYLYKCFAMHLFSLNLEAKRNSEMQRYD